MIRLLATLIAATVIAGCQKDVHEVRRTDPTKYSLAGSGYAVSSGTRCDAQAGHYEATSGRYGAQSSTYGAGGITQLSPSAPRQRPAGLGAPTQER